MGLIDRVKETSRNRALLSIITVTVLAVIFRFCFTDAADPTKCGALLNGGRWLDVPSEHENRIPKEWQPPGCMVHKYKPDEAADCLRNRRLLFAGDSTIRQVFWATAKKLDPNVDDKITDQHTNIERTVSGIKLEFVWDPYLNGTFVREELDKFENLKTVPQTSDRPALALVGTGLWYARNKPMNYLKDWRDNMDDVLKHMPLDPTTNDLTRRDLAFFAPVTIPAYGKLDDDRKKTITPDKVADMNNYITQLSLLHGLRVPFAFNAQTGSTPQTLESSGLHVEAAIAAIQADILLNLRCNAQVEPKYPYTKTCCNPYSAPTWQQWSGLLAVLAILPLLSYLRSSAESRGSKPPGWIPSDTALHALLVFGFAVVYCFYADRTQVFNKAHKHFSGLTFTLLSLALLALGYFTRTKSNPNASDQPFLFRDQTDEWKGWMQFAILLYHYFGASKIPTIYGFIRITVAAYLFMTGYGHTIYFYKKGDYSFKRVAGVMIRLNLLSCVLPYIMKTEYIFYYFAPLVSFWFFVVYFTMRIGNTSNSNLRFLLTKICVSAALVTALTTVPGALEAIFSVPAALAKTEWNVKEWRFRMFLDMFIVYIGMLTALAYCHISSRQTPLATSTIRQATIVSAVILPSYLLYVFTREDKFAYNAVHPYLSWMPIISFIVLRNATPNLRNTYSSAYAWLGRCSLETFTLQFHIWLAADTQGILDLGIFGISPAGRVANFVLSTIIFFGVADEVAKATGALTKWIMGPGKGGNQKLPQSQGDKVEEGQGGLFGKLGLKTRVILLLGWMCTLNWTA